MTSTTASSALYRGRTVHKRFVPYERRFSAPMAHILIEPDSVGGVAQGLAWFAHNRPGAFAFYDRDHGPRDGSALRPWAEQLFASIGVQLDGGALRLLTMPRVLGYVFNPISVWFGHGPAGELRGVIYEVNNTFGATHAYVAATPEATTARHGAAKQLHVSPFFDVAGRYRFTLDPPADQFRLIVDTDHDGQRTHVASLLAKRQPLTDAALARVFFGLPLATLQVVAGIHWHALWIWLRGARYRRNPGPPATPSSHAA